MQTSLPIVRNRRRHPASIAGRHRRASAALELVLTLPLLVFLILATVQFGLFHSSMQQVALASRVGAEEAATTAALAGTVDDDPVPANILAAIDKQLASSCLSRCKVQVEHNVGGTPVMLYSPQPGACEGGPTSTLATSSLLGTYVRVSVCVPYCELMPNCLRIIGYDTLDASKVAGSTTVFRYELTP